MRRVLLTGATGFVGRWCVASLLMRGFEVHCISRHRPSGSDTSGVFWHTTDLHNKTEVVALCDEVQATHLLHNAWYAEHGKYWRSPENFRWVGSTLSLLDGFVLNGGRRAVVAGSCAEYSWGKREPLRELTSERRPETVYGICKNALHDLIVAWGGIHGVSLAWGRLFFLYGEHEAPGRLVASVCRHLAMGERAPVSAGMLVRDFMHVEDAAQALVVLLDSDVTGAVNIGSGVSSTISSLTMRLGELAGNSALIDIDKLAGGTEQAPMVVADIGRLRDEVGFDPSITVDEGLERSLVFWRDIVNSGMSVS